MEGEGDDARRPRRGGAGRRPRRTIAFSRRSRQRALLVGREAATPRRPCGGTRVEQRQEVALPVFLTVWPMRDAGMTITPARSYLEHFNGTLFTAAWRPRRATMLRFRVLPSCGNQIIWRVRVLNRRLSSTRSTRCSMAFPIDQPSPCSRSPSRSSTSGCCWEAETKDPAAEWFY